MHYIYLHTYALNVFNNFIYFFFFFALGRGFLCFFASFFIEGYIYRMIVLFVTHTSRVD